MLLAKNSGFGKQLKKLREAAGLSLYQLAKDSGVTLQAISRIEKDEREPNWITILKLARTLDVSVSEFDTGEDPREKEEADQPPDEPSLAKKPGKRKPPPKG